MVVSLTCLTPLSDIIFSANVFDLLGVAPERDDLQAVMLVDMDVDRGLREVAVVVLDVDKVVHKAALVVVVEKRDNADPVTLDLVHPLII